MAKKHEIRSIREVLPSLGVSQDTGYRMMRDGRLPAQKLGGRWVVFGEELGELLKGGGGEKLRSKQTAEPRRPA